MSTAATVRAAWAAGVWADATITAITPRIYNFDIEELAEFSTTHAAKLYYLQKLNFFQYRVTKQRIFDSTYNSIKYLFPVTVRYFRDAEEDTAGAYYNAVEDAFETLFAAVRSGLGDTWSGTVDFYRWQQGPPTISLVALDKRHAWVGEYSLLGEQATSL